jgi:transglutaminase-like putative cysteine protease
MFIRIGYEIIFDLPVPTAMLLLLYTLPERASDLRQPDQLRIEPDIPQYEFLDGYGNRCVRIVAPAGPLRLCNDLILEDIGLPLPPAPNAIQHPVEELPVECLMFLLSSRYCEVDRLSGVAWKLFGHLPPGWARVEAVCTWVHTHVEFGYQYANKTKTAYEVYEDRQGVCRDFTHLAVTFCRALNIPTRYATGYLGDIGVPPDVNPMDFSACFQVYLGGQWHTCDARHNEPRIGWILMATGRDAADCAITTSFGPALLQKFVVWTDEVDSLELTGPRC